MGIGIVILFAAGLIAIVAVIAVIDFRSHIIPDWANALLALVGIAWLLASRDGYPLYSFIFAATVFALFCLVRAGYEYLRGTTGLGFGDVKMAGASALWFEPWNLPLFLLVSCVSALVYVGMQSLLTAEEVHKNRIAFGPFLGVGLIVTFLLERSGIPTFVPVVAR